MSWVIQISKNVIKLPLPSYILINDLEKASKPRAAVWSSGGTRRLPFSPTGDQLHALLIA